MQLRGEAVGLRRAAFLTYTGRLVPHRENERQEEEKLPEFTSDKL